MALVKPFKAWRPLAAKAPEIVCVPYDVISTKDAIELSKGKPFSFLHVIRPEIDLTEDTDIHHADLCLKGRENLKALLESGNFSQDDAENLYIYRLIWKDRCQTGIFGCVSTEEYNNNVILKHELTRPDKEDDRTKHILTQQAHAEPVMMTFDDTSGITELMEAEQSQAPLYEFTTEDGVQHTIWKVQNTNQVQKAFNTIQSLYIADGHHRCASAARVATEQASQNPTHTGEEDYNFFPAVLFPMQQMEILAYNRVIFDFPIDFMEKLSSKFEITPTSNSVPEKRSEEHTSELQSRPHLVCRLLLEKKKIKNTDYPTLQN